MTNVNYCPQCGYKVSNGIKFCPSCGNSIVEDKIMINQNHNTKRDKVLSKKKVSNKKGFVTGAIIVLVVSTLIIYFNTKVSKEEAVIEKQPKITEAINYPSTRFDHYYSVAFAQNGKIILPLDVVKDKKFVKFDFINNNKTIPLLAYLTEDGKVVTAIGLCEPCDSKDFHVQGSDLICNSCGTTWNLNNLDAISGSCGKYPPDPVPSIVVGNEIQINEYDVTSWTRRNI